MGKKIRSIGEKAEKNSEMKESRTSNLSLKNKAGTFHHIQPSLATQRWKVIFPSGLVWRRAEKMALVSLESLL